MYIKTKRKEDLLKQSSETRIIPSDEEVSRHSELPYNIVRMFESSGLQDSKVSVPFRFDFQFDSSNNEQHSSVKNDRNKLTNISPNNDLQVQSLHFKPSDNSFRFNFQM